MKIIDRVLRKFGYGKLSQTRIKRGYSSADMSRLTADWLASGTSSDAELRTAIKTLRNRARDAERNEDYMRRYLALRENNVIGACGIDLRVKAVGPGGKTDKLASKVVQDGWYKWGKKEFCTVTKRLTWNQVSRLVLRGQARDGGSLVRKIRGFANPFNYALQPLEIDYLATDLNIINARNEVRFGVEFDQWHSPTAYHLYERHPGDSAGSMQGQRTIRVPAEEMLHVFRPERLSATIGAPEVSSALSTMKMLRAYQEAEIVAAREAACKGYGIKQPSPAEFQGQAQDEIGRQLEPVEPGMGLLLNPGEEYFPIDPNHPVEAFAEFCKSIIRSFAAGMGVSYNSLANDLEGVNFSSIRAGLLEEREEWKAAQEWLIDELHGPIFEDWLAWSLFNGKLAPLTMADFERVNYPVWTPRRWAWVDPLKDAEAAIKAVGARFVPRSQVIAEMGGDIEDVDSEFNLDKVTKNIDTESVYAPDHKPEAAATSQDTATTNPSGRVDILGHLNGKGH